MQTDFNAKIIDIRTGTIDEGNIENIIDAYVNFQIDKVSFWAFVYEWRKYFPYWEDKKFWASNYLQKLIGKIIKIRLEFLDTSKVEKITQKEKKLVPVQNQRKPCDYNLFGEIIHKKIHLENNSAEIAYVDCGPTVELVVKKSSDFKVGDYIKASGRLDGFFVEDPYAKIN